MVRAGEAVQEEELQGKEGSCTGRHIHNCGSRSVRFFQSKKHSRDEEVEGRFLGEEGQAFILWVQAAPEG